MVHLSSSSCSPVAASASGLQFRDRNVAYSWKIKFASWKPMGVPDCAVCLSCTSAYTIPCGCRDSYVEAVSLLAGVCDRLTQNGEQVAKDVVGLVEADVQAAATCGDRQCSRAAKHAMEMLATRVPVFIPIKRRQAPLIACVH